MVEMFKTIPQNVGIPMTSREKKSKINLQILVVDGIWKNVKRDSHPQISVLNYMVLHLKVLLNSLELIGTISCALHHARQSEERRA